MGRNKNQERRAVVLEPVTTIEDAQHVKKFCESVDIRYRHTIVIQMLFLEGCWYIRRTLKEARDILENTGGYTKDQLDDWICKVNLDTGQRTECQLFQTLRRVKVNLDGTKAEKRTFSLYWLAILIPGFGFCCIDDFLGGALRNLCKLGRSYVCDIIRKYGKLPQEHIFTARLTQGLPKMGLASTLHDPRMAPHINNAYARYTNDLRGDDGPIKDMETTPITTVEAERLAEGGSEHFAAASLFNRTLKTPMKKCIMEALLGDHGIIYFMMVRVEKGCGRVVKNYSDITGSDPDVGYHVGGTEKATFDFNDVTGGEGKIMIWRLRKPLPTDDLNDVNVLRGLALVPLPDGHFPFAGSVGRMKVRGYFEAVVDNNYSHEIIVDGGNIIIQVGCNGKPTCCFITVYFLCPYNFTICLGMSTWYVLLLGYFVAAPHSGRIASFPKLAFGISCNGRIRTLSSLCSCGVKAYNARTGGIIREYGSLGGAWSEFGKLNSVTLADRPSLLTFAAAVYEVTEDVKARKPAKETKQGVIYLLTDEGTLTLSPSDEPIQPYLFNLTKGERVAFVSTGVSTPGSASVEVAKPAGAGKSFSSLRDTQFRRK